MKLTAEHTKQGYYNSSGKKIPNVTTIAKMIQAPEGLIHWAWQCGVDGKDYRVERDSAATAGHVCHAMIQSAIIGSPFVADPSIPEELIALAKQGFEGFRSWMAGSRFLLQHSEVRVISERFQYGGRLDCIASVNGELCIVDWKTSGSRRPYESWLPQIAAYRQGWNETHLNQRVEACHLMVLAKADAGFSHHYFPSSTIDVGWRAFLACLELYECRKKVSALL